MSLIVWQQKSLNPSSKQTGRTLQPTGVPPTRAISTSQVTWHDHGKLVTPQVKLLVAVLIRKRMQWLATKDHQLQCYFPPLVRKVRRKIKATKFESKALVNVRCRQTCCHCCAQGFVDLARWEMFEEPPLISLALANFPRELFHLKARKRDIRTIPWKLQQKLGNPEVEKIETKSIHCKLCWESCLPVFSNLTFS